MSRIALVRPPTLLPGGSVTTQQGVPPIGVAYLASSLVAAGHEVQVIDALGEGIDRLTRLGGTNLVINGLLADEIARRVRPDTELIGIACMFSNEWTYSTVVIAALAARFPDVPLIGGGEHVTADPGYSLRTAPALRCAVLGEGEETLVELVEGLAAGRPLQEIDGVAWLDERGQLVQTPPRARITAVDDIPAPAWDLLPLENYLDRGLGMSSLRGRIMPMLASRGCPYKCSFCSNPGMWTQRWIPRKPELVVAEIKRWIARYRVEHIEFYDLTAIVRKDWIMAFTGLLLEEDLGITWSLPSGTRSEALDEEAVIRLEQTGCRALTYAPESGSKATLKRIRKMVDLDAMAASMEHSVKHGITVKANMIMGFPDQSLQEVWESLRFVTKMARIGVHDVAVFPFVPYPGSELFRRLVDEGRLDPNSEGYEDFLAGNVYNEVGGMRSWSEAIPDRLLPALTVGGMAWFYGVQFALRPRRLLSSARRLVRGKPRTMFDFAVAGAARNLVKPRGARTGELPQVVPAT